MLHQKQVKSVLNNHKKRDFWQRSLSRVLVEWYTRIIALHPEIKKLVKTLENDEEYYVKKAVVWINKNFNKSK